MHGLLHVWVRLEVTNGFCYGHSALGLTTRVEPTLHSIGMGGVRQDFMQLNCKSWVPQSPPFAGSSMMLDYVPLIDSESPAPKTDAPSDTS